MSKEVTFKVANTEITIGNQYEVTGKLDMDAPDGFRQHNTTKYLARGTGELHCVPFSEEQGVWDTGFDVDSPCNEDINPDIREELVKTYVTHIQKPYEKKYPKKLTSSDVPDSFWKDYMVDVYKGRVFDTNNIKDRLDLFIILQHYRVCEKGDKSYKTRFAHYNIENKEKLKSVKQTRNTNKRTAIAKFDTLLSGNKEDLYTVLEWLGFGSIRNSQASALEDLVMDWFENEDYGFQNIQNFLDTCALMSNEERKEEMEMFSVLNKLRNRGKLKFERQEFSLNGEPLGNSLKDIAKRSTTDAELREKIGTELAKIIDK